MARSQTNSRAGWMSGAAGYAGRMLLLVPEASLILALMGCYWALGAAPPVGALVTLPIISFITRMLALAGALLAYQAARYREADTLAQIALALNPWSADALALRGSIALARGHAAEAEVLLRRALSLHPARPDIYTAHSCALLALARPAEAALAASEALALAPEHALAQLCLAEAELAGGAAALAVEDRLRAGLVLAASAEDEATLRCALGALLFAELRGAEALLMLRGAEALLPRCRPARQLALRVRLAELMLAHGQVERAREQFRSVAALDPSGRYTGAVWRAGHLR